MKIAVDSGCFSVWQCFLTLVSIRADAQANKGGVVTVLVSDRIGTVCTELPLLLPLSLNQNCFDMD